MCPNLFIQIKNFELIPRVVVQCLIVTLLVLILQFRSLGRVSGTEEVGHLNCQIDCD